MSIKNVLFPGGDDLTDNDFLSADSGHMRLNKARVAFFNGALSWVRLANFMRDYVNVATLNEGGDATDPEDYTVSDTGLAAAAVITIYIDDGKAILVYQDYSEFDANTFPFNRIPSPDQPGW
jgi:hypothetical protein